MSKDQIFEAFVRYGLPLLLGIVVAWGYSAPALHWETATPSGYYFVGLLNPDQLTYTAFFRSLFERGNGVLYSIPYETRPQPAVFFHLHFLVLGWLWKLTGMSIAWVWRSFLLLFTPLTFLALAGVVGEYFKARRWFIFAFLLAALGGGLSWLVALPGAMAGGSFVESFMKVEENFYWWLLSVARLSHLPTEVFFHFLVLLGIWAALRDKRLMVITCAVLISVTNVFSPAVFALTVGGFWLTQLLVEKRKELLVWIVALLLVELALFGYYRVFLSQFPVGKSLVEQHQSYQMSVIRLADYLPAFGIPLLLFLVGWGWQAIRRWYLREQKGRLLLIWIGVVLVLMNNHLFLKGSGIQPPHFCRAYLFVALSIGAMYTLKLVLGGWKQWQLSLVLGLVLLLSLPSNLIFYARLYAVPPHQGLLTLAQPSWEAIEQLQQLPKQEKVCALSNERRMGILIPAFTRHHSYWGDLMATPFNQEKWEDLSNFMFLKGETNLIEKYGLTVMVVDRRIERQFPAASIKGLEQYWQNRLWTIYRVK